jgi:rhodanese-related sulfurtransferase
MSGDQDDLTHEADALGRIPADRAAALAREGSLVLVDIREPAEWAQTGVPAGAVLAPLTDGPQQLRRSFVADLERCLGGARDRPVALLCRSGGRTAFARRLLMAEGFSRVFDVAEGVAGSSFGPGWLARGLPVQPWPPDGSAAPSVTPASR